MAQNADLFPPDLPLGFDHLSGVLDAEAQRRLLAAVRRVVAKAPYRQARTKSGGLYSAQLTNCGRVGWWSDRKGYRYTASQPESEDPWPAMPKVFTETLAQVLAGTVAEGFSADACLMNHYEKGAKMGLHQDKDEADLTQPIVTICLGADADFQIGGLQRSDRPDVIVVSSGDALIMGGDSRMRFHGIRKIYPGTSPLSGLDGRISLTFRKAL